MLIITKNEQDTENPGKCDIKNMELLLLCQKGYKLLLYPAKKLLTFFSYEKVMNQ